MATQKVLLLTSIMAPHRTALFNALAAEPGLDLEVVFLARSDPSRSWRIREQEMTFAHRTLREVWRTRRGQAFVHFSTGISRVLRELRPDVVIAGGWDQPAYLQAFGLRRWSGRAFVWWVESTLRDRRLASAPVSRAKRSLVASADAIVVPGRASAEYVHALRADPARVFVAPNAVDNTPFTERAPDRADRTGPVRFLFVGRLEPLKGILPLLDAWSAVDVPATLTIVGDGSLRERIRDRVERAAMPPVLLVGHRDREEIAAEYARADVFVFPSVSDPWGLVINEAMAASLPVVTTSEPGAVDDLVRHGANGLVTPPFDAGALATAMVRLTRDAELRHAMGARSAARIATQTPGAWAAGMRDAALAALERARGG